jgi:protein O-GlcNAc transferase
MNATLSYDGKEVTFYDVDASSHIGNCLLNVGWYERPNLDFIRDLKVVGNYVDVGAHIGTHSLFFSFFCPSKSVYAFEPKRDWYRKLVHNIRENDDRKTVAFYRALLESSDAVLPADEGETFGVSPLDFFAFEDVKLMKIDTEGTELRVLQGAKETLHTVEHLFLEVWSDEEYAKRGKSSPMKDIVAFLEPYRIRPVKELPWENLWYFKKDTR